MFKYLFYGVLATFFVKLLNNYRTLSLQLLKIEAVKCYLQGVRMTRLAVLSLMRMLGLIVLIGVGMLLIHACAFILLPWSEEGKAVMGLCLGVAYVVIGVLALRGEMSEKTWMKTSGAAQLLDDVMKPSEPEE